MLDPIPAARIPHAPFDEFGPRVPLYTPEFAADPHRAYREMRERFGALAPVELAPGIPATLVLGYRTAVRIFNDPDRFPADPRTWQEGVPADCPVLPMMQWRPNALRNAGNVHARYRQTNTAGLTGIDRYRLQGTVARVAVSLINSFCASGSADLLRDYAFPLAFKVLNHLLGCPADIAGQAAEGMRAIFEGVGAGTGNKLLIDALQRLTLHKRAHPGDDVTTRMLRHPAELTDTEMVHQLATLYGAGIEPQQNLIVNTLLLSLTDDRFGGNVFGGSLSTRDALDEVLFDDPPMANFCISFPASPSWWTSAGCPPISRSSSAWPPATPTRKSAPPTSPATAPTWPGARARTPAPPAPWPTSSPRKPSTNSSTPSPKSSWPSPSPN